MITGIKKEQNGLPKNFALAQNYPNLLTHRRQSRLIFHQNLLFR